MTLISRSRITSEMLERARDMGWTLADAGRFYGYDPKSIARACDRLGIFLPYGATSRYKFENRRPAVVENAPDVRIKAFSASPEAIGRALEKLRRAKKAKAAEVTK